jgi:hypothetical protein
MANTFYPAKIIYIKIYTVYREGKTLKVHKNENFFGFDYEFCTISLLVMSKY